MSKNRFFTKNNERVGKKSGKPRGKYKKRGQVEQVVLQQEEVSITTKQKIQELPSISRSITERLQKITIKPPTTFSWKMGAFLVFFLLIVGLSLWQGIVAVEKGFLLKNVLTQRGVLSRDMKLWESIAAKYPRYRDAYFQAAVLAYRLGENDKEKMYLEKTLEIDPNYLPARSLEKLQ